MISAFDVEKLSSYQLFISTLHKAFSWRKHFWHQEIIDQPTNYTWKPYQQTLFFNDHLLFVTNNDFVYICNLSSIW